MEKTWCYFGFFDLLSKRNTTKTEGAKKQKLPYVLSMKCRHCGTEISRDLSFADDINFPIFGEYTEVLLPCSECAVIYGFRLKISIDIEVDSDEFREKHNGWYMKFTRL